MSGTTDAGNHARVRAVAVDRALLFAAIGLGVASVIFYLSWWVTGSRLDSALGVLLFGAAAVYALVQLGGNWLLYLAASLGRGHRVSCPAVPLSVDVFVTAYDEPVALVARALSAAVAMRGPHATWLLDDGENPELRRLARRLGAGYLTRDGSRDAKAGNINAGLGRTGGEIVVIFDIDHAPEPDFLERSLPHFGDPKIGFVQVMLTFGNASDGWVAEAAADSSLDFYNPVSVGSDHLGSATLVGSNALIRREALASIGGYQPGLAEDLATSVALHSAGWKSVYVHEPLAPGFAPPDLAAWFTQQAKWARGVFELLLTAYPARLRRLTGAQRAAYAVRMTYYWIGVVVALHLLATLSALYADSTAALAAMDDYLWHLLPLGVASVVIRRLALRAHSGPSGGSEHPLKPLSLVYLTWPAYTLAWVMAVLRVPLRFRPTPKTASGQINPNWLVPHVVVFALLLLGVAAALPSIVRASAWLLLVCAAAQAVGQLLPFVFLARSRRVTAAESLPYPFNVNTWSNPMSSEGRGD